MHLLELTRLGIDEAADITHQPPKSFEKWMIFRAGEAMPPAQWLLLNLYTYCVKNICWPEPLRIYIRDRFPGALPDVVEPIRRIHVPKRPPLPDSAAITGILHDAQASLEELAFVNKGKADSWLDPGKRLIYGVYELIVMTLWSRGQYTPDKAMVDFIRDKYCGMFNPQG